MLTIWGRFDSSNVQALMWAVGELKLPYIRHDVGERFGGTNTPEFLAMNPNGTIPVLQDSDGPVLWETGAILRYLAGRYGPDGFWPTEAIARADVDRWAEWSKVTVAQNFTGPVFWQVWRTAVNQQNPTAIAAALTRLNRYLAIADAQLTNQDFLCRDMLTLADIQFGHILYRYYTLPIDRSDLPALRAYYDRLTTRPAFRHHVMIPYQALHASCPTN